MIHTSENYDGREFTHLEQIYGMRLLRKPVDEIDHAGMIIVLVPSSKLKWETRSEKQTSGFKVNRIIISVIRYDGSILTRPQSSLLVERREVRIGKDGKEEEGGDVVSLFSLPSSRRPLRCVAVLVSSRPCDIIRDDWGQVRVKCLIASIQRHTLSPSLHKTSMCSPSPPPGIFTL